LKKEGVDFAKRCVYYEFVLSVNFFSVYYKYNNNNTIFTTKAECGPEATDWNNELLIMLSNSWLVDWFSK
jgi:hypothetical protein